MVPSNSRSLGDFINAINSIEGFLLSYYENSMRCSDYILLTWCQLNRHQVVSWSHILFVTVQTPNSNSCNKKSKWHFLSLAFIRNDLSFWVSSGMLVTIFVTSICRSVLRNYVTVIVHVTNLVTCREQSIAGSLSLRIMLSPQNEDLTEIGQFCFKFCRRCYRCC